MSRGHLLAAAHKIFAARGYHEASIAEITQAADIGVGTFYLHFRDKNEIFTTLIEEGLRDIREQVTVLALQQPHEHRLSAVVRLTFHYAYAQRDLFRIALTSGRQFIGKFRAQTALILCRQHNNTKDAELTKNCTILSPQDVLYYPNKTLL